MALVIGTGSYAWKQADYQNLGSQNALLGARITQFVLERAVDNGLFDRETLFRGHYDLVDDHGPAHYRTEYNHFFDRNVVKILKAFQANDDVYYAYVINNDGFIPAHTDAPKSKTRRNLPDAGEPARRSSRQSLQPVRLQTRTATNFREFRAPILVDGKAWGEFCVGIPVALANAADAKSPCGRYTSRSAFLWSSWV